MNKILILGGGISGLGAGYSLSERGFHPILLEKDSTYGGLCGNFQINGFRFDRFVHFSFTTNRNVKQMFNMSAPLQIKHIPNPHNIYRRQWIKHPAQNNLYPLSNQEKQQIISDFKRRPQCSCINPINNYEEWLRLQFGDYFAEHFPMVYTRKYWMCEAKELETKWVGSRLYQPSIDEVILGCNTIDTPVTYYAKEMRYPQIGGFKSFLKKMAEGLDIRYHAKVIEISPKEKQVKTESGEIFSYDQLISSLPLPEVIKMVKGVPEQVINASRQLKCTSGYQISIGLKTKNIPPYLWWYIYDEDILPARVYSPSLKSEENVPEGCASLQLEVYCKKNSYTKDELLQRTAGKLVDLKIIAESDISFVDTRFEEYANVIFDHSIYENRAIVREYLSSIGIETIGRFGEWDYLWSDQSLISGLRCGDKYCN